MNGKYEYAFSVQNESAEKMMAHSRNARSIPCTREKQCLIQCDSLLQEVIITPQLRLFPKVTHAPPSLPCVRGMQTTSPLRHRAYFPPFQSGLVPCPDCSNRPEANFKPRPSASSLSLLPPRTPLLGTQAPDFEDVCTATC